MLWHKINCPKRAFGDIQARHIGPALMSGRITDLEVHPTNNKIIYTWWRYGKSNDGGAFNPIFDEHIQSIGCVAIDPSKPDQTFGLVLEKHGLNSVSMGDGFTSRQMEVRTGRTWDYLNLTELVLLSLMNSDIVWVGVLGALWESSDKSVYKTTDGEPLGTKFCR
jgi:hypothetical protein